MASMADSLQDIRVLDELGDMNTIIHKINPLSKLIVTLFYLLTVLSFNKYATSAILPLVLYPVLLISLANLPVLSILKRVLIVIPLIIGISLFNPILDQRPLLSLGHIIITYGWISFTSILLKSILTIIASLILIAITGMTNLSIALRMLKIPKIVVLQLLLTYRYIEVLMEEVILITTAYALRAPQTKGIQIKDLGPLLGQLLLRTIERGQSVYYAMCCRGFIGEYHSGNKFKLANKDITYILLWGLYFLFVRHINISRLLGIILTGAQ